MNRFHVHVHVAELDRNIDFYSRLFGAGPHVRKSDYAKWLLDDPAVNFAISTGGDADTGIAHLGLQAADEAALAAIGARLHAAGAVTLAEVDATCCYAKSDKFWAQDPQGVRWETFRSHGQADTYYADPAGVAVARDSCCGQAADSAAAATGCVTACSVPAGAQVVAAGADACCA